jgi:hypothetical protein
MKKLTNWDSPITPAIQRKILGGKVGCLYAESCFYLFAPDRKNRGTLTAWEFFVKTRTNGETVPVGLLSCKAWKNDLIDLVMIFL